MPGGRRPRRNNCRPRCTCNGRDGSLRRGRRFRAKCACGSTLRTSRWCSARRSSFRRWSPTASRRWTRIPVNSAGSSSPKARCASRPVAWQDKVYFVSDDGHLYCVDAANGQLRWKFQGRPPGATERKLLGNGRLISLWPARGGPVLHDGMLYFGCGLWSDYGVCVHALDANSGAVVWSNTDSNHIPKANMDHGIANVAGLTPQGYLAVVNDKLVVPCGAQLPAFLDLKTGKLGTYCMGWGGRNGLPKGTWFVAGAGHYLSHGGDLYDITRLNDEHLTIRAGRRTSKACCIPAGSRGCASTGRTRRTWAILAAGLRRRRDVRQRPGHRGLRPDDAKIEERKQAEVPAVRRDDTYPDKWTTTFRAAVATAFRSESAHQGRPAPVPRRARRGRSGPDSQPGKSRAWSGRRRSKARRIACWRPTASCSWSRGRQPDRLRRSRASGPRWCTRRHGSRHAPPTTGPRPRPTCSRPPTSATAMRWCWASSRAGWWKSWCGSRTST